MLEFVAYQNYKRALNELNKAKQTLLNCVAFNTVAFNKLYMLDILPLPQEEYPYQKQMNDVFECMLMVNSQNGDIKNSFISSRPDFVYYKLDILYKRKDFVMEQSKYFLTIAGMCVGDGVVCEPFYDDLQQFKFLIDVACKNVIEEINVAEDKLKKEIERLDQVYNFSTPKPPQKQKYQKKDAFLDQFTSGSHICSEKKEEVSNNETSGKSETIKNNDTDIEKL